MFDKIGRLAEAAATNVSVSRRGFFGRIGQVALGAAGALGGLLLLPGAAQAHGAYLCCHYTCGHKYNSFSYDTCVSATYGCPSPNFPCKLNGQKSVSGCLPYGICGK